MQDDQMSPTWSVTTLTRNTKADFCRYVAWYFEQGASRLHLYFHNPEDPNIALVENDPRVDVVRLTPQLMEELEIVHNNHGLMQNNIGPHAYSRAQTDWMLRCDIDELIYCVDGRKPGDLLATLNQNEIDVIRLEMAEHLAGPQVDGMMRFRIRMNEDDLDTVYGDVGKLLVARQGLIGHRQGKSMSRTGVPFLRMNTHSARMGRERNKRPRELVALMLAQIWLLHFNAGPMADWMNTLEYRLRFSSFDPVLADRLRQLLAEGDAGLPEIERIFQTINEFDDERFQKLVGLGYGVKARLDIDGIVRKHFPDTVV
jgi:hypothetical protein